MFGADFGGAATASALIGAEAAAELAVRLPYSRTMDTRRTRSACRCSPALASIPTRGRG